MSARLDPSARPGADVRATGRHPVAVAADDLEPRSIRLGRCADRAEGGLATLRALLDLLAPQEETDARVRDELASR